jgi:undecaprenyl-diphosphatase
LRRRFAPLLAWLRQRLSPGSYLGLALTAGVLLFVGAAWLFGGVAEDVVDGDPLTIWDDRFARWFHAHQHHAVTSFMQAVSAAHEWVALVIPVVLFLTYLAWRRSWAWAATVMCAIPGGMLLNTALKFVFHRDRPTYSGLAAALHSYSFPSGHVMAATLFWGTLALYIPMLTPAWRWRVLAVLVAGLLVALVALSRMYLGVHYFSDVLAAAAEGVAWLMLCRIAINTYVRNRTRN